MTDDRLVLIVDDFPELLAWAHRAFERDGWRVLTAGDAEQAERQWLEASTRGDEISLLVTDLELPGMDGFELARRIREHDPTLPIIFMTGHIERLPMSSQLSAPGTEYFVKPMGVQSFLLAAESLVALRERRAGDASGVPDASR